MLIFIKKNVIPGNPGEPGEPGNPGDPVKYKLGKFNNFS